MSSIVENLPVDLQGSMLSALRDGWTARGWSIDDLAGYRMDGEGGEGGSGGSGDGGQGGSGSGSGGSGGGGEPAKTFTQDDLNRIMAREKDEGKRAAERAIAEALGMTPDEAKKVIEAHREAEKGKMTEAERKAAEADEARKGADSEKASAAEEKRIARIERALVRAHVADDSLDYAVRMVLPDVAADATPEQIGEAVEKAKKAVPALFGATPPGGKPVDGDPPGTPPRRQGNGSGGDITAARQRAREAREKTGAGTIDPLAGLRIIGSNNGS